MTNQPLKGIKVLDLGHYIAGPYCGKLMAEILIDGEATTVDVSMLDYNRFTERRLIQEYNVV